MSFIACLGNCKYQKDGYCSLERVSDWNGNGSGSDCIYYTPTTQTEKSASAQDGGNRLTNTMN